LIPSPSLKTRISISDSSGCKARYDFPIATANRLCANNPARGLVPGPIGWPCPQPTRPCPDAAATTIHESFCRGPVRLEPDRREPDQREPDRRSPERCYFRRNHRYAGGIAIRVDAGGWSSDRPLNTWACALDNPRLRSIASAASTAAGAFLFAPTALLLPQCLRDIRSNPVGRLSVGVSHKVSVALGRSR
jgi:hypothetical protein